MNLPISASGLTGLLFVLIFFGAIAVNMFLGRRRADTRLRAIPAFERLGHTIGLAVEAGRRLHFSLGWANISSMQGASAMVGLKVLARIARFASVSDRPPVATSGEGSLGILSRDTLQGAYRLIGVENQYDPNAGQVSGLTPFSFAAGAMPVASDQQVSANILIGHFGSEVALITDASERNGSLSLAGSDNLPAQAVLYAAASEPLIGEEVFAAGAYVQAGPAHTASLHAQDFFRWALVAAILAGIAWKILQLAGVL